MVSSTHDINAVLNAWVDNFVVDVPAKHINGEYLIPLEELEKYVHELSYDDRVNILLEVEENYL